MRTRIDGDTGDRYRHLLEQHARALALPPTAVEPLVQAAALERWALGDAIATREPGGGERVGLLVVGAAKISCETPRGRRVGVCFVPPGRVFTGAWPGDAGALAVVAHDPVGTVVAWWDARAIAAVAARLPSVQAVQLATALWQGTLELVREKCHLLGLGLRDRVLAALTALARDFGRPHPEGVRIELRVTHADLAGAAVGSRANVTRALEDLRADGAVAVERQRLIVTHRGLGALAREAPLPARPPLAVAQ